MITIVVTGDREWTDRGAIATALMEASKEQGRVELIHGGCRGADTLAGEIGGELGFNVTSVPYRGDLGRAGGPVRNQEMLDQGPDLVLAFHSDLQNSKGTKDCVTKAKRMGIPVRLIGGNT